MAGGYWSPIAVGVGDGPTLTAAAAATCLPVTAKVNIPANGFIVGNVLRVRAMGRISCVITTPGTARFSLLLGGTTIFDSGPMNLNIVAKTTVPWWLEIEAVCRVGGASGQFFGFSRFQTEAVVGSAVDTAGGNGALVSSVSGGPGTAPALGGTVDLTVTNALDMFFTQTAGTGSMTVHNFLAETGMVAPA